MMVAPRAFAQQEVQLSEYMFNGLTLNPALAGSHEAFNAQLMYRQWAGLKGGPMSYTGSVDGMLTQSNSMGWGLSVVGEQMGLMKTMGAYANYSFRVRLNKVGDRLSLGLAAGVMQEKFGGVDLGATDNQSNGIYDPDEVLLAEDRLRPDFRVGAYYSWGKTVYAGLSASNLGSFLYTDSIHKTNPYLYLNLGGNIYFGERWKLSPSLLMTYPLEDRSSLDFNVAATYADRFWVGAGLRTTLPISTGKYADTELLNSVALMAEVWITHALRIGYCYDYHIGRLSGVQSGSHEVSLGITLARKVSKVKSPREVAGGE